MAKLVFAPLAERDLNEILDYISHDRPLTAVRWVQKIRLKCATIAENPEIGERRPEFKTGEFRCSPIGSYVIFYRPIKNGVDLLELCAVNATSVISNRCDVGISTVFFGICFTRLTGDGYRRIGGKLPRGVNCDPESGLNRDGKLGGCDAG